MTKIGKPGFNADLQALLNSEQLKKLEAELASLDTPAAKEMPRVKDELRRQIVGDLKKEKMKVSDDDIQGLLKLNAADDIN